MHYEKNQLTYHLLMNKISICQLFNILFNPNFSVPSLPLTMFLSFFSLVLLVLLAPTFSNYLFFIFIFFSSLTYPFIHCVFKFILSFQFWLSFSSLLIILSHCIILPPFFLSLLFLDLISFSLFLPPPFLFLFYSFSFSLLIFPSISLCSLFFLHINSFHYYFFFSWLLLKKKKKEVPSFSAHHLITLASFVLYLSHSSKKCISFWKGRKTGKLRTKPETLYVSLTAFPSYPLFLILIFPHPLLTSLTPLHLSLSRLSNLFPQNQRLPFWLDLPEILFVFILLCIFSIFDF